MKFKFQILNFAKAVQIVMAFSNLLYKLIHSTKVEDDEN